MAGVSVLERCIPSLEGFLVSSVAVTMPTLAPPLLLLLLLRSAASRSICMISGLEPVEGGGFTAGEGAGAGAETGAVAGFEGVWLLCKLFATLPNACFILTINSDIRLRSLAS